jgi:enamine deaminase RidA (YjgF/YER057c/UK114 family)
MGRIESRLTELGIVLPETVAPAANYVPFKKAGSLIYISGQVPSVAGKDHFVGKLGQTVTLADGQAAARICAINVLAQLKAALGGDLDRVTSCIRLGGFVNCAPDFGDQPKVINGASDLIVEVFGEIGRHARAAVGCASLPRNVAVEVDAIFEAK